MVQISFDARQYEPSTGGQDIFETGEYSFQIVQSEVKQTKAGDGTMLIFTLSCLDQGFSGKRLTVRLNVVNKNPQAVDIAMRELSAIAHVTGVLAFQDTQQLHGKPFRVRVEKTVRNDDPSKFGNEVKGYLDMNGNPPGQQAQGSAGGAPQAPQAPTAPQVPQAPAAPAPAQNLVPPAAPPVAPVPQAPAPQPQAPVAPPVPAAPTSVSPPQIPAAPISVAPTVPSAPSPAAPPWAQPQ